MKLAVTGASGLIGANVIAAALAAGHEPVGLARAAGWNGPPRVPIIPVDILGQPEALEPAFAGAEVVIHTAATFSYQLGSEALHDIAVRGTRAVLHAAAAAGVRRVVVTSSSVVFGYAHEPRSRSESTGLADPAAQPPYVAAKIAQHREALELGNELGLEIVLACPTITLGPTASALGPSNGLILAYLADKTRSTYPGGCNIAAAVDVAAGHLLLAERGEAGAHYLLGSDNLTWAEIHREIGRLAGVGGPLIELSPSLAWLAAGAEEFGAKLAGRAPLATRQEATMLGRYYWYDDDRARSVGYEPRPARQALLETVSWLIASRHVSRELRSTIRLADEVQRWRYRERAE